MGKPKKSGPVGISIRSPESNSLVSEPADVATILNNFFTGITSPEPTYPKPDPSKSTASTLLNFQPVSPEDITKILFQLKSDNRGGEMAIPASVYKCLAKTIVPALTVITNSSISNHSFPDTYKKAVVTPVHKKGDKSLPTNFRPISSLPILSKVVERIIQMQITSFIEENKLLSPKQFGFRRGLSTEQFLLNLTDIYYQKLDSKTPVYIAQLCLDVRKAFDTVKHRLLCTKLINNFSFSEDSVSLIKSNLSSRTQVMKLSNQFSDPNPITTGVPQGSILGPLLFNLAVNDMLSTFQSAYSYADDTVIFCTGKTQQKAMATVTTLFSKLANWYDANGLALNIEETQCLILSNRPIDLNLKLSLHGKTLDILPHIKMLGIFIDSSLTYNYHIQQLTKQVSSRIYVLRKIRKYLNYEESLAIYKSLIRSRLEYCSALLGSCSLTNISKLESCQNKAIRVICRAPAQFSITQARTILGISSLSERRSHYFSKIISLISKQPDTLLYQRLHHGPTHDRDLRNGCALVLPSTVLSKFGPRSFKFRAIKLLKML